MVTTAEERLAFDVQWKDPRTDVTWKYQLYLYPACGEIEMFDVKNRKTFLRRCLPERSQIVPELLRPGATITVLSRQLQILAYGDNHTSSQLGTKQERTLAVVKPDAVNRVGDILQLINTAGFLIGELRMCLLSRDEAERFYSVHREQPFFMRLIDFMTSGRIVAIELLSQEVVRKWLELMGPTDSEAARQAAPASVRALFGTDQTRNAVHGSDSLQSAAKECSFFFGSTQVGRCCGAPGCSLCLVKPHAVLTQQLGSVISTLLQHGLAVSAAQSVRFTPAQAVRLLEVYRGVIPLSEFRGMVEELCSGASFALEVSSGSPGSAVEALRSVCGPADPVLAKALRPETLRARFGVSKVQNAVHCTDLEEDAAEEISLAFAS